MFRKNFRTLRMRIFFTRFTTHYYYIQTSQNPLSSYSQKIAESQGLRILIYFDEFSKLTLCLDGRENPLTSRLIESFTNYDSIGQTELENSEKTRLN